MMHIKLVGLKTYYAWNRIIF